MWHGWGTGAVHAGIRWGDPRKSDHLEDLDIVGRVILRCLLNEWGQGQVAGSCERGNEASVSIKYGEFLEQPRTCQLLSKDSAPWMGFSVAQPYDCIPVEEINSQLLWNIGTPIKISRGVWRGYCGQCSPQNNDGPEGGRGMAVLFL